MTRRGFFGLLAAAIAGATLDPERALWIPGQKLVSIPAPAMVASGNVILTPKVYARLALENLSKQLYVCGNVNRSIADQFTVRRPRRFVA